MKYLKGKYIYISLIDSLGFFSNIHRRVFCHLYKIEGPFENYNINSCLKKQQKIPKP